MICCLGLRDPHQHDPHHRHEHPQINIISEEEPRHEVAAERAQVPDGVEAWSKTWICNSAMRNLVSLNTPQHVMSTPDGMITG